ncbi:hypothetical protein [Algoriphagus sp. PAP.12]|uniref:hypothetical protein n=1 Tax=Algoriphagus sp. PAP.12 TaxID=2996678 RepID=UPI00227C314C|nr:hypothetical protein [Algoriphagus sp. PAP.12]
MKIQQKLLVLFLIIAIISGCDLATNSEEIMETEDSPLSSVLPIISNPENFKDKPFRVTYYQGTNLIYIKDKYYNSDGNEALDVYYKSSNLDTAGITIYTYQNNLPVEKNSYPLVDGEYIASEKFTYLYDDQKRLLKTLRTDATLYMRYEYNQENQIDKILFSENTSNVEGYQFYYDETGNISRQVWSSFYPEDSPIRDWHYIYDNEGKLKYKSIPTYPDGELNPMFVYLYDDQGRQIEEQELYPEYGFVLHFRKTYEYPE